ncbi:LuxE/PaaK family acyltransferase [Sediminitomix flava]|uniref:Acyl-protein synthetase LuxE n=1 Tax=Sediminitomix flava TaxID=379075 RepID=A0A315Z832_SEDFL|nr:acyl transferase [Sediminitomix flava]PWJ41112.1 acyl-protein synthetase LuxE [Sediminitomix flava]
MRFQERIKEYIFSISTEEEFESCALEVFKFQAEHNKVYSDYLKYLKVDPLSVQSISEIPFLPIRFFKSQEVVSTVEPTQVIFRSSGTTGSITSKHLVSDPVFYQKASKYIFESFYGDLKDFEILALLPSYLERGNSSLVYMVEHFLPYSGEYSGFYLDNVKELQQRLEYLLSNSNKKILLIGVTFALLDLAEEMKISLDDRVIVMETGGMKGRRKEMLRSEVHEVLQNAWDLRNVHSEYGMTELLSQAYSKGNEVFDLPPWMRIRFREINDPFSFWDGNTKMRSGGINVIDLANVDSCSFIETQDIGQPVGIKSFKVLGRFDNSDIRGCNLLVN